MESRVRSGRRSWFQRGGWGKGEGAVMTPFYRTPERYLNNSELSPARESQELQRVLREVLWVGWRGV
jgi:hypothetical protein